MNRQKKEKKKILDKFIASKGQKFSKGNCRVFDSPIKQTRKNNGGGIKK